jgi:signal transduction histidine kinase
MLSLELVPSLPPVVGDRVQLQQVLVNLMINGIQAMATADRRELRVESEVGAGEVAVAVHDSGVGLDPESASRLFSAFFTTKPNGMGMGLSICRSIIEAHAGRISASGHDGPGAVFRFTLPIGSDTNV